MEGLACVEWHPAEGDTRLAAGAGRGWAEHSRHKNAKEHRMFDNTAGQLKALVGRERAWSPTGRAGGRSWLKGHSHCLTCSFPPKCAGEVLKDCWFLLWKDHLDL